MSLVNDIEITNELVEIDRNRFNNFIPNYLNKLFKKGSKICSVGCGMGYDVEVLNDMGYDTYGFDPGNRTKVWSQHRKKHLAEKLRIARAGDPSLEGFSQFFDYAYALEVIEHVGTDDGVWRLSKNFKEERIHFLESCMDLIKPNGKLLITTSNRLCPIDLGHGHHYNFITDFFSKKGIRLTNPLSRRNFVCSISDITDYLDNSSYRGRYKVEALSTANYPSNSRNKRGTLMVRLFGAYLRFASMKIWRTSFLNPILAVEITKLK